MVCEHGKTGCPALGNSQQDVCLLPLWAPSARLAIKPRQPRIPFCIAHSWACTRIAGRAGAAADGHCFAAAAAVPAAASGISLGAAIEEGVVESVPDSEAALML